MSGPAHDYHSLRNKLLKEGRLFNDLIFPPTNRSLVSSTAVPRDLPAQKIVWMRPKEIVRMRDPDDKPRFVTASMTRADLDQGKLGDCWFVAAASVLLTGSQKLIERVIPLDQSFDSGYYAGVFRFNFWRYGVWTEVVVDDFLPTDGSKLLYCKNRDEPNEFWCALLEKAYAKLNGSYEAIDRGKVATALVDMTGGIAEMIDLSKKYNVPRDLFQILLKSSKMNSLMGASSQRRRGNGGPRMKNGLYLEHAYGITAIKEVPYQGKLEQLLRLRNPHGRKEWLGPWSDESKEMESLPKHVKEIYEMEAKDEGEFWISFEDFVANFVQINMCHLNPDAVGNTSADLEGKRTWSIKQHHGKWIKGISAGGCGNRPYSDLKWINPQYHVDLWDTDLTDGGATCTIIISLMEKEQDDPMRIGIGFDIYKVRSPLIRRMSEDEKLTPRELLYRGKYGTFQLYREVVKRFQLPPGHYVIIPMTFYPDQEAEFLLRVFTEQVAGFRSLSDSE